MHEHKVGLELTYVPRISRHGIESWRVSTYKPRIFSAWNSKAGMKLTSTPRNIYGMELTTNTEKDLGIEYKVGIHGR
jgi:hypothetical protein